MLLLVADGAVCRPAYKKAGDQEYARQLAISKVSAHSGTPPGHSPRNRCHRYLGFDVTPRPAGVLRVDRRVDEAVFG